MDPFPRVIGSLIHALGDVLGVVGVLGGHGGLPVPGLLWTNEYYLAGQQG